MTLFDVAIVGAGPAGSSLAIRLAGKGHKVLLLDKDTFPRDKTCGDLVSTRGLELLDELGCLDAVASQGYIPLRKAHAMLDGKWLNRDWVPYQPNSTDHAHAVPRIVLDEILFRKAQTSGAETAEGCRVRDISIDEESVRIGTTGQGNERVFTARMIVGADGAHSIVARKVGQAMADRRYMEYAMRAYCHGLPLNEYVILFEEEFFPGFGWVFPISREFANVGVGLVADSAKKFHLDLNSFFRRIAARLERWAAEQGWKISIEKPVGWPIKTYGGAGKNFFDRGLLIGEAACFVDPINGEGIPLAMQSASIAAETISDAFANGRFDAGSLSSYEIGWRRSFDRDLSISDLVVSAIRNRHLLRTWMDGLRLVCATARSDPEYAWKAGGVLAGTFPIHQLIRPELLLKSVAHGPRFWMDFYNISPNRLILDLLKRTAELGRWELSTLAGMTKDAEWLMQWTGEIARKQAHVVRGYASRGR